MTEPQADIHGDAPSDEEALEEMAPRRLIVRVSVGLLVILAFVAVLAIVLQEPLTVASQWFVSSFGLPGVFVATVFTDTFLLTHEPILFVGYAGGLGFWPVFYTASAASVFAGPVGWTLGTWLGKADWLQRMFTKYRIDVFMRRYGFWAVAVAALTPFPFSVATWASGAAAVPLPTVLLGSLFRVPKVAFYFGFIVFGWDVVPKLLGLGG